MSPRTRRSVRSESLTTQRCWTELQDSGGLRPFRSGEDRGWDFRPCTKDAKASRCDLSRYGADRIQDTDRVGNIGPHSPGVDGRIESEPKGEMPTAQNLHNDRPRRCGRPEDFQGVAGHRAERTQGPGASTQHPPSPPQRRSKCIAQDPMRRLRTEARAGTPQRRKARSPK